MFLSSIMRVNFGKNINILSWTMANYINYTHDSNLKPTKV